MKALIIYFSGTGNTKSVAGTIGEALVKRGISAEIHSTEEKFDLASAVYDYLFIGFPKYYEHPILLIYKYLECNLQKHEKEIPTFAFSTQAGPLPTDFSGLARLLKKKNHRLSVAKSFAYANNMMIFQSFKPTGPAELSENKRKIKQGIEPLLNTFLSGKTSVEKIKAWKKPLFYLVAAGCTKFMPVFAMRLSASEECTACGLCAKKCPAGNISMVNGRPGFKKQCLFCMRCINACPTNAIMYDNKKCIQYKCEPFE